MNFANAAGSITAILTLLTGLMAQLLNCKALADMVARCETDILPAKYVVATSMVFAIATLLLKSIRPGGLLASWFGQTAVVVPAIKSGPGTVTKAQVNAP